ncbi:hypothetical protein L211DRAFT_841445 [Terfezia boudieri ATCC MYA-4762]|uniref:MIF4G domain-containing protein n=1 Tax=Terfezia boudieri ATCC MYA-4762 TaxID=1051890 RepID=A0A3N4LCW8_9PEZI|nr:hypothetical protein L211DRAFT_841445 [Terfezia boudieri ATCC MYA-4762]
MAGLHYAYPGMYQPYAAPPPASPRNQFSTMGTPAPYLSMTYPGPSPMSRTPSAAAADIHRPPSGFGPPPNIPMSPPAPTTFPTPDPNIFKKPEKGVSKGIKIVDPLTRTTRNFDKPPETPKDRPVVVTSTPVIVTSVSPAPRLAPAEIKRDFELQVQKKKEETEAREKELLEQKAEEERSKREAEEAEKKKRREEEEENKRKEEERKRAEEEQKRKEEERKHKEEEEERLRKEAEEKARLEEEERIRKEEEAAAEAARIAKEKAEEEIRIAKEKEEEERQRIKAEQEEAERKAEEEVGRLAKEEEERKAKEEAESKAAEAEAAAKAAAAAATRTEEVTENITDKPEVSKPAETEGSAEQVATSTAAEDTMRPPAKPKGKPSPLVLKTSTEPGPPSAALTALRSARFIGDINSIKYPEYIMSPNPALNAAAPAGKFKYQKDFLLQFQSVFTEKPHQEWDKIIRETVGEPDSARPQTARMAQSGMGQRSGSRPGATSAQPPMGTMGSFGSGKFGMLPANMLTSAQRFEQSNSRPGPISSNPLQALGAVGQFRPGPPSISRTNSSQGLSHQGGSIPQSPRARSQRGSSKRGNTGAGGVAMEKSESKQAEPKPILTIPPSDVKPLVISESRWKPRSVQAAASTGAAPGAISAVAPPVPTEDNRLAPELVQRKVKAALNKMTPEKFDKISGQILDIASQSKYETDGRTLRQVIQLTFEKATDEAAWSSMYAKFCKVMMESMDPSIKDESIKDREGNVVTGGILFRKYLLNRCQEEFQRGWKVNLPPKPEGETDEAAMLSDEYYIAAAAKRRGLGLIQFIGELFKLGMLTERIMHECVKKLVDYEGVPEEAEVESLCKLLRTIGASLDATGKSRPMMDVYFARIQTMIDHPELQSRLKFMLMDVVDLRKKNWQANETDKGPKTLAEIQADVAKAAAEKEAASRANSQRGGRQGGGRGDNRNFLQGGFSQSEYQQQRQISQNTLNSDELRKLKSQQRDRNVTATQNTFGPPSMFASRGSNPKKMGPTSFNRGDDSGPASRTATPPSGATTSRNSFHVLGDMGSQANDGDANDSVSPAPSAASSPPLAKVSPAMRSLSGKE